MNQAAYSKSLRVVSYAAFEVFPFMQPTRFDCSVFRGDSPATELSSFVALNPLLRPAQMVFAGSSAIKESVGSQVAYRLALDYFVSGVERYYGSAAAAGRPLGSEQGVAALLEEAFRSANSSVYSFGHKLAAGGKMAASLLAVVIEQGRIATARVGFGSVYLFRAGELFPFFDAPEGGESKVGDAQEQPDEYQSRLKSFIGANAMVDVELASVVLQPEDIVCAFSRPLTTLNETLMFEFLDGLKIDAQRSINNADIAERLCYEAFTEPDTLSFALVACIGPQALFCSQVAAV